MANGRRRRRSSPRGAPRAHGLRVIHHDGAPAVDARRTRVAHFDHDGSPRVTPARGASAHGFFQPYASCADLTQAAFLSDPAARTPAFVRFSSVLAARRGADTVRDVRSFAVKLFTTEGNFDLVGQSCPVLHLEEGVRFPDTFHTRAADPLEAPFDVPSLAPVKAALWSYAAGAPRASSSLLWLMSDRALPRSLRMMAGYGVHTYRLVDAAGGVRLAKLVWRPLLGTHALDPNEAELLVEEDPDFHRRDLWEAIEEGDFPEWELCVQIVDPIIDEPRARALGINVLDATHELPEEAFPLRAVGKLTLTRNPASFYKDVDGFEFHPSRTVPGIDFTDDPALQTRLASDLPPTPGFAMPVASRARPPRAASAATDPFAAAARFYRGLASTERRRVQETIAAELDDVPREVRARALVLLRRIGEDLVAPAVPDGHANHTPIQAPIQSRRVAVLVADGVHRTHVDAVVARLGAEGARVDLVARSLGSVTATGGAALVVDQSHRTASSLFYDAVFVPGGAEAVATMSGQADTIHFIEQAFAHGKPIGVLGEAALLLERTSLPDARDGVVSGEGATPTEIAAFTRELVDAMRQHRFFARAPLRERAE